MTKLVVVVDSQNADSTEGIRLTSRKTNNTSLNVKSKYGLGHNRSTRAEVYQGQEGQLDEGLSTTV